MAATWAQVWAQIPYAVKHLEDARSFLNSTYLTNEAAIATALNLETSNANTVTTGLKSMRSTADSVIRHDQESLNGFVSDLGRIMKSPNTSPGAIVYPDLHRYMFDNPDSISPAPRILSRQFVRGAWTNGSPFVGSGSIIRLLVDEDGLPIENTYADTITAKCVRDRQGGATVGQEVFEFRGRTKRDRLNLYDSGFGSGLVQEIAAVSSDDSENLLVNPSFGSFSGTAGTVLGVTGWLNGSTGAVLTTSGDSVTVDQTYYYRAARHEGSTPGALKMGATKIIRQALSATSRTLSPDAPYYLSIAFNAEQYTAVGTLEIYLGNTLTSVTVTGLTGWQRLTLPLAKGLWLKNFNVDNINISITFTRTSGSLLIDDIVFCPFKLFDNQWVLPISAATPFAYRDVGTFTDTETGAKIARWFWLAYNRVPPMAPAKPSSACSAALAGAGAGNLTNGAYGYKVTYYRTVSASDSIESAGNTTAATVTVVDAMTDGRVSLTSIPTGAAGTTGRKIYRTVSGGSTYKLLATIADNSTTTYADNIADASLGAAIGTGVTIDDPS